jgi:hypothetical protein
MPAWLHAGCPAAEKNDFGKAMTGDDTVGFKKRNGKEWNRFHSCDGKWFNAKLMNEVPVYRVVSGLVMKYIHHLNVKFIRRLNAEDIFFDFR